MKAECILRSLGADDEDIKLTLNREYPAVACRDHALGVITTYDHATGEYQVMLMG